ncbi:MAG TPA: hypothetical protein VMF89_35440, partial [Polyangiales bacterium]|nr:hypothetical protein [Polyangiales bacterium]
MATIDWSYDLLSNGERTVLRRLSTFAGAFDLRAACAVAVDESRDRASLLCDLASLVAKSFVAIEAREIEMEYRLLDTTRAYALEKLAESSELGRVRKRHAEYFLGVADEAGAVGERSQRTDWLARYGTRIDDIRDARRWAFSDAGDVALGVRLTVSAIPFWERLYLLEECRQAVEVALDARFAAQRSGREEAALYVALGATWLYTRGPELGVKSALTRALELGETLQETSVQLESLRGLSEYELWTGDIHASIALAQKLRTIDAASGAHADAPTGSALRYLGVLEEAQSHLEKTVYRPAAGRGWQASRFEFDQRVAALG